MAESSSGRRQSTAVKTDGSENSLDCPETPTVPMGRCSKPEGGSNTATKTKRRSSNKNRQKQSLCSFNERNSDVQTNSRPSNQKVRDISKVDNCCEVIGDVIKAFLWIAFAAM
jgi:hypothetical protein